MNYKEFHKLQVNDPRWKAKSAEIKDRDKHECQKCGSGERLNVHHKLYIVGKNLWDYPDDYLITYCAKCHTIEHESDKAVKQIIEDCKLMMTNTELEQKLEPLKVIFNCKYCGSPLDSDHVKAFGRRCFLC